MLEGEPRAAFEGNRCIGQGGRGLSVRGKLDELLAQRVVARTLRQLFDHLLQLFSRGFGIGTHGHSQKCEDKNELLAGGSHRWFLHH